MLYLLPCPLRVHSVPQFHSHFELAVVSTGLKINVLYPSLATVPTLTLLSPYDSKSSCIITKCKAMMLKEMFKNHVGSLV